jgi:hypothetical protein|tara:strand:+ start:951 stop:1190 length:240 start_codon:yes stop_codon:yes gene_type:complete
MRNIEVIRAWKQGRAAKSSNGNLSTDGVCLYSYRLVIGHRGESGFIQLQDYTARGTAGFRSMTTSHHVNMAKPYADVVY